MFVDSSGQRVFSTLGWVDHGAVWIFDAEHERVSQVELSDAGYVTLRPGAEDCFAVVHHWDGSRVRISGHRTRDPGRTLATVDVRGRVVSSEGDQSIWARLPTFFVGYLDDDATGAAGYYLIAVRGPHGPQVKRLDWFDDPQYDHVHQGLGPVSAVPGRTEVLFGVQRSSALVLWDWATERVTGRVPLADRDGNPDPLIVSETELWAADYDTVVKLDPSRWAVTGSVLVQPPDPTGRRMFIGDPYVDPARDEVLIPRPGSGDVVVLDREDLSPKGRIVLGGQPLVAAATIQGRIVARDRATGELLLGSR